MAKEAFTFSGDDASNYETWLGPILFEPSSLEFMKYIGTKDLHHVLEISAGTGRLTRHLRDYFPFATSIVASDISPDMLEIAKENLKSLPIEFQTADAQNLPFDDNSFDLVVWQYGLMFLPDKQKGVSEAFRVLKPEGRLILSTWDSIENIPLLRIVFNETIIPFFEGEDTARYSTPFSLYDPAKLNEFLTTAGLKNKKIIPVEFGSRSTSPKEIVNAFLLKHPLGREVANKERGALQMLAKQMEQRLSDRFGKIDLRFKLKALISTGQKS
jgi:ubiquinone/menaquinone biosynthesis C-methylase UbiE